MPKKTESTGTGLESYVAKLMGNGSNRTSVTEDEIQVALKDIDVSDEQLTAVYSALRNSGIQIISASGPVARAVGRRVLAMPVAVLGNRAPRRQ